jgi:hypothetical protein
MDNVQKPSDSENTNFTSLRFEKVELFEQNIQRIVPYDM